MSHTSSSSSSEVELPLNPVPSKWPLAICIDGIPYLKSQPVGRPKKNKNERRFVYKSEDGHIATNEDVERELRKLSQQEDSSGTCKPEQCVPSSTPCLVTASGSPNTPSPPMSLSGLDLGSTESPPAEVTTTSLEGIAGTSGVSDRNPDVIFRRTSTSTTTSVTESTAVYRSPGNLNEGSHGCRVKGCLTRYTTATHDITDEPHTCVLPDGYTRYVYRARGVLVVVYNHKNKKFSSVKAMKRHLTEMKVKHSGHDYLFDFSPNHCYCHM